MRGRRWYPVLVLILAALSCAEPLPEPYRRGDLVPVLLLQDRERQLSLDRGRSWFILYFAEDTAQAVSRAVYLDRLVERLDNSRLGAVAVISTKAGSLLDGFATVELDYPVFLDRGNRYSRQLHNDGTGDRLWVLDRDGRLHFEAAGKMLMDGDLRQLAEKLILGHVTERESVGRYLEPGDSLPSTRLTDLAKGDRLTFAEAAGLGFNRFVIFTADCVACNLSGYLTRFHQSFDLLQQGDRRTAGIFSGRFSTVEVAKRAVRQGLEMPIFVAREEIEGIEDGYYLQSLIDEVVVIDTDPRGVVLNVESFQGLLGRLRRGKSE